MNTLLLLLRHPEALAAVRADPALLGPAAEEARRLIPPVTFVERWTRETTTVAGVEIPPGEFIGVSVLGTNRDPATFTRPLEYDLHRPNTSRALTFSFGPHACLGLHLARLQTTIALRRLLDRLPGLSLGELEEPAGFAFRRPATMQVTW
jgi:hypothetical protein